MTCRAASNRGAIRIRPQASMGTFPSLTLSDGLRVHGRPQIGQLGEGMVNVEEEESPMPGGTDPVLGSYGESLTIEVPVPVTEDTELSADHAFVRLMRACGCSVSIATGTATINALLGGCVGFDATDVVPIGVEWAQRGGLTHRWVDAIGAVESFHADGGGVVLARVVLHARVVSKVDTTAFPAVTYPGQAKMLAARNATLEAASESLPGLYSWELQTGITAQEQEDQLAAAGLAPPFVYQSDVALFNIDGPQAPDYSEGAWAKFLTMADTADLELRIKGQTANDVLEIDSPRFYTSPQTMGDNAGHRTDARELTLKPSGTTPAWTIRLNEQPA